MALVNERINFIISAKDRFSGTFGKLKKHLPSLRTMAIGTAAGVTALGAGLFKMAKDTADAGDEARKSAQALGLSTETFQSLAHASNLAGVEQSDFFNSMRKLSDGMKDTSLGLETYARTYREMGIEVTKADGTLKSNEQILMEVADAFSKMENGANKTALASDLFGRSGAKLIPLLNSGAEGIKKMQEEAHKLGFVISDEAAKSNEEFNDSFTRLQGSLKGVRNTIGQAVIPQITELAKKFTGFVVENKDAIAGFAKSIIAGFKFVGKFVGAFIKFGQAIGEGAAIWVEWADKAIGAVKRVVDTIMAPIRRIKEMLLSVWDSIQSVVGSFAKKVVLNFVGSGSPTLPLSDYVEYAKDKIAGLTEKPLTQIINFKMQDDPLAKGSAPWVGHGDFAPWVGSAPWVGQETPRYHSGGALKSDERLIIGQVGEGVVSRQGMNALSRINSGQVGGAINVNVGGVSIIMPEGADIKGIAERIEEEIADRIQNNRSMIRVALKGNV